MPISVSALITIASKAFNSCLTLILSILSTFSSLSALSALSTLSTLHAFVPSSPEEEGKSVVPEVIAVGVVTVSSRRRWRKRGLCDCERDRIRPMCVFVLVAGMGSGGLLW